MRRAVPCFLTAVALIAAAVCAGGGSFLPAKAQDRPASRRLEVYIKTRSPSKTPFEVARGDKFSNVRAIATDTAGGLYISLSATPEPQDCVSSAISVPQALTTGKGAADVTSSSAAKIPLTIFSNCALARTEDPWGIAVASGGSVFLANRAQNSIRLLDMITGKVSAVPVAAGARISAQSASSNLDPYEPAGLAADRAGDLYVADRGNGRVLALHAGAKHFSYIAHVLDAAAVAVNAEGTQLFVASPLANRVFVIDLRNNALDVFAGSGAPANSTSAPAAQLDSNPAKTAITAPEGVAVDGVGNVFITDTGANTLLRVDAASGEISPVESAVDLISPGALAIDRQGNVFVADRGNARVLEFAQLASPQSAGAITITPASFDFGAEPTGGTTPAQQFTLTNGAASALTLSNQSFAFVSPATGPGNPADFAQTNSCVPSVPAGGSCLVNVTFTPGGTGARLAVLQVTDGDPNPPTAAVSGTGDDFQLTAASQVATIQNVAPGQTATYSLSVTPDGTFSGTVALACPAVLSANTQTIKCSINPASVAVTPGQSQTFTVTLATGGPNSKGNVPAARRIAPPNARMRILLLCVFALAVALCVFASRHAAELQFAGRQAQRARFAAFSFALVALAAAAGCKYHAPPVNPNETPPGIYTFDITGTAQNASRSITLTLNVD